MAVLNLLGSFGKAGVDYGLVTASADVNDIQYLSKYFVISDFSPLFTAGRNSFSLNGSSFLMANSEIFVQCIDSAGNNLYIEMATVQDTAAAIYPYKEATSFVMSIHVYGDTADGIGQLIVFGTLVDSRTVKWQQNITIDKTQQNTSRVRFYTRPVLEVDPILIPVLSTQISSQLIDLISFNGRGHGEAISPPKDTILPSVNLRNIDIDYRIVCDNPIITGDIADDRNGFTSQMIGSEITLNINKIQVPYSTTDIAPIQQTSSFIISDIINNKTIQLISPYYYPDTKNNSIITNISDTNFNISYPYVVYNNQTSSYLTTNLNGATFIVQQSYAEVVYRNIRTFTGFAARHKLYRKSLLSSADFSIIADEPLFINELLKDTVTQNSYYSLLGKFYNDNHIARYWFTSSNNLQLQHTPDVYIDSAQITSSTPMNLIGNDYIMVKNDSVNTNKDAIYIPFDQSQFNNTSGSSYDSNFIELRAGTQYILQVDTIIEKDPSVLNAILEFYFTSSIPDAKIDPNFTPNYGIRLASLYANQYGATNNFNAQYFFYTPQVDLFGTLVIVPYRCEPYLQNISFRVYGDDGFSPDLFETVIPWNVNVANETFQIKAELFDIDHKLIYSDFNLIQSFDPSGSSLIPYNPGGSIFTSGSNDALLSGNLVVSKSIQSLTGNILINTGSLIVSFGSIFNPLMSVRSNVEFSSSRIVTKLGHQSDNGKLAFTPLIDVSHDNNYLYVVTGSISFIDTSNESNNPVGTKTAIASRYGRQIFWDNLNSKHNNTL